MLAPKMTAAFSRELEVAGHLAVEEEPGIYRVDAAQYSAYVIETDRLAGLGEPILTFVSREFLDHPRPFVELFKIEFADVVYYMTQQIQQFSLAQPKFEEQHMAEKMYQTLEEMRADIIAHTPIEQRLRGLSYQERMQGVPVQERLQGVPVQERLQGLTAEELKRLKKLLDEQISS